MTNRKNESGIAPSENGQAKSRHRQKGFTLIEVLVVLIILGLLAALVGPDIFRRLGTAKQGTAKAQIAMLMAALDGYRLDVGDYPAEQEGLEALLRDPGNDKWAGPYLAKGGAVPLDPWNQPYHYRNPGEHGEVDIFSYGLDKKPDGEGEDRDVGSWQ